jgi:ADP-heptose:LPS heptosyltransferase
MKVLIIRFSSIGDLTQALSLPSFIKHYEPTSEIHFVTRDDLASLLTEHPQIDQVLSLNRKEGFSGLFKLISQIKKNNYTHIYDAHHNLRSFLIRFLIWSPQTLVKPMMRLKRFLLIQFQINLFEKPFSGQRDLIKPLEKWGYPYFLPSPPQLFLNPETVQKAEALLQKNNLQKYVILVPSAAYVLKRWPLEHWKALIQLQPELKFVVLAGPSDSFTAELDSFVNVLNLTGKTSLQESAALIAKAQAVVTNDTGLLHFSEQLGKPTVALMGPAPFGFPSRDSTYIFEKNLKCRPCSKHGQGPCTNSNYQDCLKSISPEEVSRKLIEILEDFK